MSQQYSTYELVGGQHGLRELVDRFYDLMERKRGSKCNIRT